MRAGNCIAIRQIVLQGCVVGWEENCIAREFCIAIEGAGSREQCIAIHCTVLWLEGLQESCIAIHWAVLLHESKARLDCIAIQCPAKPRYDHRARGRSAGAHWGRRARDRLVAGGVGARR